ncbi:hypothetical protein FSPOR_553 [Fusarium sporotrichioides]|uniref:Uncharacterized protein n=1 Tax=Fusarium sporotrichioides TaxID=5514 RepID=A0A395SV09_FUSSP|nr:hypothetical protein FSPOR_553 [Fusarium sporotrichioides]
METSQPTPLAWTVSMARGFLAGLIFIGSTRTSMDQGFDASFPVLHSAEQWTVLHHIRLELEEIRLRLVHAKHAVGLARPDKALDSFDNPTSFYEAAISGFHNTLVGLPPTTLGGVVALCAMSHMISCYSHSTGHYLPFDLFSDFDLWRNAISDHEHRRPFDDLVKATCIEPYLTALMDTLPVPQFSNDISDEALDSFEDLSDTMHDSLTSINSLFTSQDEHPSHNASGRTQLTTGTQAPDLQTLQGSPIVTNLTDFLEQCGELPLILAGRGVAANKWHPIGTPKPDESADERHAKRLCSQLLQDSSSIKSPIIQGIVFIVDRFVHLGYLQSTDEVGDYMLLIGKV